MNAPALNTETQLHVAPYTLRPWSDDDVPCLVRYGNNRKIWRNVGDAFPHPYTEQKARDWITFAKTMDPARQFGYAVEFEGEAIGGIGYERLCEGGFRTAQLGYWYGEPFWGKGIATRLLAALTDHLFANPAIHRCQAYVYAWNPASARVLEKAGYTLEGRMRDAVCKDGEFADKLIYGKLRY